MKIVIDIPEIDYDLACKYPDALIATYAHYIKDGIPYEERPKGEWIITGEEQGALGITYKIKKCPKCGWEHSLVIPDNFRPNCGAGMRGGKE